MGGAKRRYDFLVGEFFMKLKLLLVAVVTTLIFTGNVMAFCGFYVAKADTKLFNKASKVVLVRDGDKTVITMASDYEGDPKEFALVVPVPTFIERGQINVGDNAIIDHLDAYSAPRLVEYFDEDPCAPQYEMLSMRAGASAPAGAEGAARAKSLGVKIEATYQVGEYDILILSAEESSGLETWLKENGYKVPDGASEVLGSYIKQNMRFFVAKVNIAEKEKLGVKYLRPIQVAFDSPKFMLPIRLGTVNASGPQDLFIFVLTKKGRVETTNYRTIKLPEGMDIPLYVKSDFQNFYRAMFDEQVKREKMKGVFLEYAWDMGWCDPCAADPLSNDELKKLGVFWVNDAPTPLQPGFRRMMPPQMGQNVFLTRLHVRYSAETFPEDLAFQETSDRSNFQGRYVLRHPWKGEAKCEAAKSYFSSLPDRLEKEAQTLANLTGWEISDIRKKMEIPVSDAPDKGKWWEGIWG